MDHVPVGVGEHLHLDVAGGADQPLQEQCVVAERGRGNPSGSLEAAGQVPGTLDGMHAFPAAACRRLDQQRVTHLAGRADEVIVAQARFRNPGHHRHPEAADVVLGSDLVAHDGKCMNPWPNENDPCLLEGTRKRLVFAEEAVSGMDSLRAGRFTGGHDRPDVEVAFARGCGADAHRPVSLAHVACTGVGVAVDGNRPDAEGAQRPDDPAGDLAAVGNKDSVEKYSVFHGNHILKRPKEVSGSGALAQTSSARPRTRRVSAGSMMPSSQSRAVE